MGGNLTPVLEIDFDSRARSSDSGENLFQWKMREMQASWVAASWVVPIASDDQ